MGEVTTDKVEKIVKQALDLHQAACPSVKAVGDALIQLNVDQAARHEEQLKVYHETEIKMLEGTQRMKEHSGRLEACEEGVETNATGIQKINDNITNTKTRVMLVVIKWLAFAVLCGGLGAGTTKLLGG